MILKLSFSHIAAIFHSGTTVPQTLQIYCCPTTRQSRASQRTMLLPGQAGPKIPEEQFRKMDEKKNNKKKK